MTLAVIQWLQSAMQGPFWEALWLSVTRLYSEEAILPLLPIAFWVTDRSFARLLATVTLGQLALNPFLKGLSGTPRPPQGAGIRVYLVDTEGGYSLPSGHAQGAAAILATLARRLARPWFSALAALLILLIGISRIYLGVHYPADVLAGWAVGLTVAYATAAAWPALGARLRRWPLALRLLLAAAAPALVLGTWAGLPFVARVGLGPLYPGLGALAGMWCGSLLEERYLGFDPRGGLAWQAAKCAVGLASVLVLRYGLKALLPAGDWFTFLRYAALGLYVTLVAPWIFARLPGRPSAPSHHAA